jgi:hypothetical protein
MGDSLLRLYETDHVALGVGKPGEFTGGNRDRRYQHLATECSGLVEIGFHVVYLYIDGDVIIGLVTERGDVAVDAFGTSVDEGGARTRRFNVPIEEPAVKRLRFGIVPATDLEMDNGFSGLRFSFDCAGTAVTLVQFGSACAKAALKPAANRKPHRASLTERRYVVCMLLK